MPKRSVLGRKKLYIAGRKKANAEPLYQAIFDATGAATAVIGEDAIILRVNRAFEHLTGFSKKEVEDKKSWKEFVGESCPNETTARPHRMKSEPHVGPTGTDGGHEVVIVSGDGSRKAVHVTISPVPGAKKKVATLLDITPRKEMEETIRESEEKFRLLFEKSADAALLLDGDVFVDCNEAALRLMRCEGKDQLLGLRPSDISPATQPDGRPSSKKAGDMVAIALKEGINRFEWVHTDFHGEKRWINVSLTVIPVRGKQMIYAMWRDLTGRRQAEARLRESEEGYRAAIESSNDGVLIVNGKKQVYVNQRLVETFGYDSAKEIIESKNLLLVHPDDKEMVAEYVGRRLRGEEAPRRYGFKGIRKDGTTLDVEVSVAHIVYRGEPVYLSYLRDVTGSRLAEAELRRSEQKYRNIFENAMEGIFQTSPEGRLLSVNPAFARMFGYESPEEIMEQVTDVGRQLYVNSRDREDILGLLEQRGVLRNVELEALHREGRRLWVSIDLSAICDREGKTAYYEGTFVDITERKAAEEALRKREKELQIKSENLEDANTALRVLLRQREEDKKVLQDTILSNLKEMVFPYLEKLKRGRLGENEMTCISILESGLDDIVSPLLRNMAVSYAHFTPMEIQVANLTRAGKTSKEISHVFGLSKRTIDTHKNNLRKKLDLSNKKVNLQSYLRTISTMP